jgi:16S rRNA (guanine527-N7)-methyltransferase
LRNPQFEIRNQEDYHNDMNNGEEKLKALVSLFLEENEKVNLSALRTPEACWTGHVLDSLSALESLPATGSVLDLGTGGGFPLLPLAMMRPELKFVGLDSTRKKLDAVSRMAKTLGLKNVEILSGRAETLGHDRRYREKFSAVLSRAVAELNVLLEFCSPFCAPDGAIVLWKSMAIDEELRAADKAMKELKCELKDSMVYDLPGDFGKRQLLIFEKTGKLDARYPRDVGVPKKKPL